MKKWTQAALIGLLMLGFPSLTFTEEKPQAREPKEADLQVIRDGVAAGISNREPMNLDQVFPPSIGRIYYFTEIRSPNPGLEIAHVWYYGEREVARVSLPVGGTTWRTWSSKEIFPTWTGQWKVEALTSEGTILASRAFSVEPAPAGEPERK